MVDNLRVDLMYIKRSNVRIDDLQSGQSVLLKVIRVFFIAEISRLPKRKVALRKLVNDFRTLIKACCRLRFYVTEPRTFASSGSCPKHEKLSVGTTRYDMNTAK